jgi:RNA polymerase sigma-70 factor, ECF subfamily
MSWLAKHRDEGTGLEERHADRRLVRRILAGDQQACVELVRQHHAALYRMLFHLCRDEHRAEDLVQETFASAWTGLAEFSGTSALGTWLYRIGYRKFLDVERRRTSRVDESSDDAVARSDERSPDPVQAAIADEDAAQLYDALAKLPPEERDVVVLHHLQGLTFDEISEVVGVPPGTLRWRKSRALVGLRRLLQEKYEYETD